MNDAARIAHLERLVSELTLEVEYLSSQNRPQQRKPRKKHRPWNDGEREQRQRFIRSLRRPCMDCGEDDLRVIEFHHRDPKEKRGDTGTMIGQRWSEEEIQEEVRKCDPLCPTCHRKRHL